MKILLMLIFVSVVLVAAAIVLFLKSVANEDFDHVEELSLMPLGEDSNADTNCDH